MNKNKQRRIQVYAHWTDLSQPIFMGTLSTLTSRGKKIFSFSYHNSWLTSNQAHSLDPSLQLFSGPQYASQGQENFEDVMRRLMDYPVNRFAELLPDQRLSLASNF